MTSVTSDSSRSYLMEGWFFLHLVFTHFRMHCHCVCRCQCVTVLCSVAHCPTVTYYCCVATELLFSHNAAVPSPSLSASATLGTTTCQAPQSAGFPRRESFAGVVCCLLLQWISQVRGRTWVPCISRQILYPEPQGSPIGTYCSKLKKKKV